jgi:hypothetical protein
VEGLFDLPPCQQAELIWDVKLPLGERDWNIGLIVAPSGCGNTTVARALFAEDFTVTKRCLTETALEHFPEARLAVSEAIDNQTGGDQVPTVPGVGRMVGKTNPYQASISLRNPVGNFPLSATN